MKTQTSTKSQIPKEETGLGFEFCDLFVIWYLSFGIYVVSYPDF